MPIAAPVPAARAVEREFRLGQHAQGYLRRRAQTRVANVLSQRGGGLRVGSLDVTDEVHALLQRQADARVAQMMRELPAIARDSDDRRHLKHGVLDTRIHPVSYHYWGKRLGYECWRDEQFVREYQRDNPYSRVHSRSRTPRLGWTKSLETAASDFCRRHRKLLKPV